MTRLPFDVFPRWLNYASEFNEEVRNMSCKEYLVFRELIMLHIKFCSKGARDTFDQTLNEIAQRLNCDRSGIKRALKRLALIVIGNKDINFSNEKYKNYWLAWYPGKFTSHKGIFKLNLAKIKSLYESIAPNIPVMEGGIWGESISLCNPLDIRANLKRHAKQTPLEENEPSNNENEN